MADFNFLLSTRLSQDQQQVLEILQQACRRARLNLYLTGGPMRDLLIGHPVRFLHFTTEGSPLGLAQVLAAAGAEHVSPHPSLSSLDLTLRGVRLRLAAAQSATGPGTIVEDLRRRGLTVNSIGLSLSPGSRGLPIDPTNGAADIEARLLRITHPYVFLEDPIVLLRTVRLATRLEFAVEERTQARMDSAREGDYLQRASPGARGQELEAIAYEPDPATVLRALEKEGWLAAAFGAGVRTAKMNLSALTRLAAVVGGWELLGMNVDSGLAALPLILGGLPPADQNRLAQLLPSRHLAAVWKKIRPDAMQFEKRLLAASAGGGADWLRRAQEVIERTPAEAVVFATLEPSDAKAGKKLKDFQAAAALLRQRLPLGVLRAAGMAPHSQAAEALLRPWYRRLLGGESLSDADLAEGMRKQVADKLPAPAASKSLSAGGKPAGGKPALKSAIAQAKAGAAKVPAKSPGTAPPSASSASVPAKKFAPAAPAKNGGARPASKPAAAKLRVAPARALKGKSKPAAKKKKR
ncbi:MAG TPA: hypothetical protein VN690_02000 [Terriglobales bacterium]|nr:hypothetical protein [Terriglobales bacterium]